MDLFMMKKFNKDKYLKKLRFKKYKRYLYIGIPCLLVLLIGIYFAYSKFSVFKEKEVVRTTVGDFISGDIVITPYIDGKYSDMIPGKNDGYAVDKIVCDNDASASWDNDSWGIIVTNLTKRTKCNIYFAKNIVKEISELAQNDTTNFASDDPDNNIRYIGANPDNYVYFNCSDYNNQTADTCELWRIIGVFNNVTKPDGSKENLVKIISDETFGDYNWNTSNVNDWTTSSLQETLDNYAVNHCTPTAIEEVEWNLGGSSTYNDVTASMFYERERGTTVYGDHATTWTGIIGLMYPSDYGYATSGGSTKDRSACLAEKLHNWSSSDFSDCKDNDYLFDANLTQWTLTPDSTDAAYVFAVSRGGFVSTRGYISDYSHAVRPTIYLKSSIKVKSGTGEKNNPYTLSVK